MPTNEKNDSNAVETKTGRRIGRRGAVIAAAGCLAVAGALGVGSTLAYFTDSSSVTNRFSVAEALDIEIEEPHWNTTDRDGDGVPDAAQNIVPTQTIPKDPAIVNEAGTEAWMIAQVKVPVRNASTVAADGSTKLAAPTEMFSYKLNSGWTQLGQRKVSDDGQWAIYTYGADRPVAIGGKTPTIFDSVTVANVVEGNFHGECQVVVDGFGIQRLGFDSVSAAWNAYCAQNAHSA